MEGVVDQVEFTTPRQCQNTALGAERCEVERDSATGRCNVSSTTQSDSYIMSTTSQVAALNTWKFEVDHHVIWLDARGLR